MADNREWHDLRAEIDVYCEGLTPAQARLVLQGVRLAFEHFNRVLAGMGAPNRQERALVGEFAGLDDVED